MWLFIAVASIFGYSSPDFDLNEGNDTIVMLKSVEIMSEKHELFSGSAKRQSIDTVILKSNHHSDFASVLGSYTPVSVKSYGPGILSTTSLRGGSASHTAFIWNGFNLQSPMHAQNELSLIPVSFADEIQVHYGGGSTIWGTGAVGGAIIMNNKPDFSPGQQFGYHSSATTNRDFHNSISTQWSNGTFATSFRLFHHHAKNQYRYINSRLPDNPEEKQEHAGFEGWGLLQETHYKPNNNHIFNLRAWFQQYERNIPSALFQDGSPAQQDDDFLRLTAQWQGFFNNIRIDVKTGYFEDYIHYNDNIFTDSESRSQMQTSEAGLRYYFPKQNTVSLTFNHQYVSADVDDYMAKPSEHRYTLLASWRWKNKHENFITSLNFRQKFARAYDVEPTPCMGITYRPSGKFAISANIGNNYRLPTLNDRYWSPGGNPDLKPESGWSQDINFELSDFSLYGKTNDPDRSFDLDHISIALFHRKMKNWISWVPGSGGLWTPENILEVRSYGAEANKMVSYIYGDLNINTTIFYSWTRSIYEKTGLDTDASIGKQLIYTPEHRAGINAGFSTGPYRLYYNHSITGKRYTAGDNSRWLDPYHVADIYIAYERKIITTMKASFFIKIHNIWNQDYEVMQARPMPLRYFRAGLSCNINYGQR